MQAVFPFTKNRTPCTAFLFTRNSTSCTASAPHSPSFCWEQYTVYSIGATGYGFFHKQKKTIKKNLILDFYAFLTIVTYLWRLIQINLQCVLSKETYFLLPSWKSLKKRAGFEYWSGSGTLYFIKSIFFFTNNAIKLVGPLLKTCYIFAQSQPPTSYSHFFYLYH
jgi:hypothetical protein